MGDPNSMSGLLIDADPVMRSRLTVHDDPDSEHGVIFHEEHDITPVLEANARERAQVDERARWTKRGGDDHGIGTKVASIPMSVYYQIPRDIREDGKELLKWIERSENDVFRTRAGRLHQRGPSR